MGPIDATIYCMMHPFRFAGRGRPSEYWWFMLVSFLINMIALFWLIGPIIMLAMQQAAFGATGEEPDEAAIAAALAGTMWGFWIYLIASIWPAFAGLAAMVRRLHDTGRSGWWYWISLVPLIGPIWLLILLILPSDPTRNDYGPPPGGGGLAGADGHGMSRVPVVPKAAAMGSEELRALRHARMQQG